MKKYAVIVSICLLIGFSVLYCFVYFPYSKQYIDSNITSIVRTKVSTLTSKQNIGISDIQTIDIKNLPTCNLYLYKIKNQTYIIAIQKQRFIDRYRFKFIKYGSEATNSHYGGIGKRIGYYSYTFGIKDSKIYIFSSYDRLKTSIISNLIIMPFFAFGLLLQVSLEKRV